MSARTRNSHTPEERELYWFNRQGTDKDGSPQPLRGQGEYPATVALLRPGAVATRERIKGKFVKVHKTIKPAMMGIHRFKREHTESIKPAGLHNPKKHLSIRSDVLRNLKADSWAELIRRERKYY